MHAARALQKYYLDEFEPINPELWILLPFVRIL
jgi:hypothetical protein